MASRQMATGLIIVAVIVVAWSFDQATAQTGCTVAITSMAPCLTYVTGNSSTPSSSCCSALATVVQSSPRCLCSVLGSGAPSLGFTINQTQALQLPGACRVTTPPVSQCNAASGPTVSAGSPVGAPVGGPSESSGDTPYARALIPSSSTPLGSSDVNEGGSKTNPSTPSSAADHGMNVPKFVLLLLLAASYSCIA